MKVIGSGLRLSASDVANFLACQHLTRLDLLAARGELKPPRQVDVGFLDLVARGEAHEQTVLSGFRAAGLGVAEIAAASDAEAARATLQAIRDGADVIYQGVLLSPPGSNGDNDGTDAALLGLPDFLIRAGLVAVPDGEPRLGGAHYEVVDAKLARSAKGRAVAQTAFYTHLLTRAQGVRPRWMHLALGHGELASFRVGDYAAYERQTRRVLGDFIAADLGHNPPADPYPEPVEHCAICRWSPFCASRRRRDDDLSLIAGVTADQRRALKAAGVPTRRAFAGRADLAGVRAGRAALERAQRQARLQVASEDAGRIEYELLDPERDAAGQPVPNRGPVRPVIQQVIDSITEAPAWIRNARHDILAIDPLAPRATSPRCCTRPSPAQPPNAPPTQPDSSTSIPPLATSSSTTTAWAMDAAAMLRLEAGRNPHDQDLHHPRRRTLHPKRTLPPTLGLHTTSNSTAAAANGSATPRSANSTSTSKPCNSPPNPTCASTSTPPTRTPRPPTDSNCSPAGPPPRTSNDIENQNASTPAKPI